MRIESISRNEGVIGDEVIIRGDDLGFDSASSVTFNGVLGKPTLWNPQEIRVAVPAGAVTGPLCIASHGEAKEVQFTVDTVPHGKERTFQTLETGPHEIRRNIPVSAVGAPIASANPEATNSPVPTVRVKNEKHGPVDEAARAKERETRVIAPPENGHLLIEPKPGVGKDTEPVVITGPQHGFDPNSSLGSPASTPPDVGHIVAPLILSKEQQAKMEADAKADAERKNPKPPAPVVPPVRTEPVANSQTNQPVADVTDKANPSSINSAPNSKVSQPVADKSNPPTPGTIKK